MAEVDRLGALQVGVAGHRPVAVGSASSSSRSIAAPQQLDRPQRVRLDDHRHVGRDLVVARAAGVELAGERADLLAEQALDRHVDVLVGVLELEAVRAQLARATRSSPASICSSSSSSRTPISRSARACARDWSMS